MMISHDKNKMMCKKDIRQLDKHIKEMMLVNSQCHFLLCWNI